MKRILAITLLCLAGLAAAAALFMLAVAGLAFAGILADVSPDENRQMGIQIVTAVWIPASIGICCLTAGILLLLSASKSASASNRTET